MNVFRPFKITRPFASLAPVVFRGLPYQALLDLNPVLLVPSINDARAEGRLWQDSAMTTPATAVDDPVGAVEDFSGNAYHLTASGTARPLLKQDGGGNWCLQTDGVNDTLTCAGFSIAQPFTTVTATRVDANNSALFSAAGYFVEQILGAFSNRVDSYAGNHMADGTVLTMGEEYIVATTWNGASSSGRLNGAPNLTGNVGSGGGGQLYLGSDSGSATWLTGAIFGFAVFPTALSSGDIAVVESYLASQSGVTL